MNLSSRRGGGAPNLHPTREPSAAGHSASAGSLRQSYRSHADLCPCSAMLPSSLPIADKDPTFLVGASLRCSKTSVASEGLADAKHVAGAGGFELAELRRRKRQALMDDDAEKASEMQRRAQELAAKVSAAAQQLGQAKTAAAAIEDSERSLNRKAVLDSAMADIAAQSTFKGASLFKASLVPRGNSCSLSRRASSLGASRSLVGSPPARKSEAHGATNLKPGGIASGAVHGAFVPAASPSAGSFPAASLRCLKTSVALEGLDEARRVAGAGGFELAEVRRKKRAALMDNNNEKATELKVREQEFLAGGGYSAALQQLGQAKVAAAAIEDLDRSLQWQAVLDSTSPIPSQAVQGILSPDHWRRNLKRPEALATAYNCKIRALLSM